MRTTNYKILVIEDDLHIQKIIQRILLQDFSLRSLPLDIILASDGEEGITLFQEHRPDLVITDLLMPKADGFAVVEAIRSHPEHSHIPVVVTSAVYKDKVCVGRLEHEMGAHFVAKPLHPRILAQKVFQLLRGIRPTGSAVPSVAEAVPEVKTHVKLRSKPDNFAVDYLPSTSSSQREKIKTPYTPGNGQAVSGNAWAVGVQSKSLGLERLSTQGSIAEHSVGCLLFEAYERQFSGTLDLRYGNIHKLVYMLSGHPIFVQSNQRSETLGQMLIRRGVLSAEQHAQVLLKVNQSGVRYGEALVQLGLMTEAQVMAELSIQTQLKLEACLRWRVGTFCFTEDSEAGSKVPRCTVEPVKIVFEGLKHYPNLDDAFSHLASKGHYILQLSPRFSQYCDRFASIWGHLLVDTIVPGRTVAQIIQVTGMPQEAVLQLDALLQSEMIELTLPPRIAKDTLPKAPPALPAEPFALESIKVPPPLMARDLSQSEPNEEWDDNSAVVVIARGSASMRPPPKVDAQKTQVALQLIQSMYLGLHGSNYYQILGVLPKSDPNSIEVAYRIKRKQFDLSNFQGMDLGEYHAHLDEICAALDQAYATLSVPSKRAEYDQHFNARPLVQMRSAALEAEGLYHQGEELLIGERYAEAAQSFSQAIELDEQAAYKAMHALAIFKAAGQTSAAVEESMMEVQLALALDPEERKAYLVAAKISRALGHTEETLGHLRKMLELDPKEQEGFNELASLLIELGDYPALELEYRRVLHALSDQDRSWSAELWRRLAILYRDQLHQVDKARLACESALQLDPTNHEMLTTLADLNQRAPERWPEAVLGYRSLLRSNPQDPEPLHVLFKMHQQTNRRDAALVVASAAELLGVANVQEKQFLLTSRTKSLRQIARPLDPSLWDSLRHPDDDPSLAMLFRLMTPVIQQLHPLLPTDLGLHDNSLQSHPQLSEIFEATLNYVIDALNAPMPQLIIKPELENDIQSAGTEPPVLLVGCKALSLTDPFELCFRLARAISLLSPGRVQAMWRPRRVLRNYILTALSLANSKFVLTDLDGTLSKIQEELQKLTDLQVAIKGTAVNLQKRFQYLNINDWQKGIHRTAERIGLLLCTDLGTAKQVLNEDADAMQDLLDFALSETYGDLRASLGLALE